ncbi:MAG: cell division protein ZapB [Syntrophales bacterium]|nr:cell division protein ZapB [Syntrophales bacterium]
MMVDEGKFDQLEAKIKEVVDSYVQLRQKAGEMEELIRVRDQELSEAQAVIQSLKGEREAVRVKVESLLDRLEGLDDSR